MMPVCVSTAPVQHLEISRLSALISAIALPSVRAGCFCAATVTEHLLPPRVLPAGALHCTYEEADVQTNILPECTVHRATMSNFHFGKTDFNQVQLRSSAEQLNTALFGTPECCGAGCQNQNPAARWVAAALLSSREEGSGPRPRRREPTPCPCTACACAPPAAAPAPAAARPRSPRTAPRGGAAGRCPRTRPAGPRPPR